MPVHRRLVAEVGVEVVWRTTDERVGIGEIERGDRHGVPLVGPVVEVSLTTTT